MSNTKSDLKQQLSAVLEEMGINIPDLLESLKYSRGIIHNDSEQFESDPQAQVDFASWNREQTILLASLTV
jgi:hypothetical protein